MQNHRKRDAIVGTLITLMPAKTAIGILTQQKAFVSEALCLHFLEIVIQRSPLNDAGGHKLLHLFNERASNMVEFNARVYVNRYLAMVFKHKDSVLKNAPVSVNYAAILSPVISLIETLDRNDRERLFTDIWLRLCVMSEPGTQGQGESSGYQMKYKDSIAALLSILDAETISGELLQREIYRALSANQEGMAVELVNRYWLQNDMNDLMGFLNDKMDNGDLDEDLVVRIKRQLPAIEYFHFAQDNKHLNGSEGRNETAIQSEMVDVFMV